MGTTNDTIRQLLEMLDNPEAYTEQEILDIINRDEDTRETYRLMVEAKRSSRQRQADKPIDVDAAWQRFEKKRKNDESGNSYSSFFIRHSSFQKIAASFVAVLLITGVAYAAIRLLAPLKRTEMPVLTEQEKKMLMAFRVPADCKNPIVKERGDGIIITWLKGTWIEGDDYSYIEERPVCESPFLAYTSFSKVMLDGKELDINNLPDLPASALKKMEKHFKDGKWINLITTPVQIPADVKGNINPELTILLTGTPPADAKIKSSIYVKEGIHKTFDWKQYQYTSWTSQVENISNYLSDVAIRKDHHVRVNICRGVPQKQIDRLEKLMREKGVLKYDLVRQ